MEFRAHLESCFMREGRGYIWQVRFFRNGERKGRV